jgi:hypothetical protein
VLLERKRGVQWKPTRNRLGLRLIHPNFISLRDWSQGQRHLQHIKSFQQFHLQLARLPRVLGPQTGTKEPYIVGIRDTSATWSRPNSQFAFPKFIFSYVTHVIIVLSSLGGWRRSQPTRASWCSRERSHREHGNDTIRNSYSNFNPGNGIKISKLVWWGPIGMTQPSTYTGLVSLQPQEMRRVRQHEVRAQTQHATLDQKVLCCCHRIQVKFVNVDQRFVAPL